MTIKELKEAISNIESALKFDNNQQRFSMRRAVLESVLTNYKELLRYKKQSLGLSPIKVGDLLYMIWIDEYISQSDEVETVSIEYIEIGEEGILFKADAYDGVICDLKSFLEAKPYGDKRIFTARETAEKELAAAKERKNLV